MSVKLLTKHHLEFLSLKGGCTGSTESTLVKMPHCWKSHVRLISSDADLVSSDTFLSGQYIDREKTCTASRFDFIIKI